MVRRLLGLMLAKLIAKPPNRFLEDSILILENELCGLQLDVETTEAVVFAENPLRPQLGVTTAYQTWCATFRGFVCHGTLLSQG